MKPLVGESAVERPWRQFTLDQVLEAVRELVGPPTAACEEYGFAARWFRDGSLQFYSPRHGHWRIVGAKR